MENFTFLPNRKSLNLKTNLTVSQALPYLVFIAECDGLRLFLNQDMSYAWYKFKMLLIICEQYTYIDELGRQVERPLQYWVKRDFFLALSIYNQSLIRN